jgi:hypothetical protein
MPRIDDDGTVTATTDAITDAKDTSNTDVIDNDNAETDANTSDTATDSQVEDTNALDMPWINPETTKNLIDIAVDILKQTIDNETQTMTSLVGIAVDILTKTIEARKDETPRTDKGYGFKGITLPTLEYTLPKASVRLKDIIISSKTVNYYDINGSPVTPSESTESHAISRIVPVYDGTNVKITAYTILDDENGENGENGKNGSQKIIDELDLGEINLAELKGENKEKKIQEIIENLKKKFKIDSEQENSIKDYLDRLGGVIDALHNTVIDKE